MIKDLHLFICLILSEILLKFENNVILYLKRISPRNNIFSKTILTTQLQFSLKVKKEKAKKSSLNYLEKIEKSQKLWNKNYRDILFSMVHGISCTYSIRDVTRDGD